MFEMETQEKPELGVSDDYQKMPEIPVEYKCGTCGLPAPVEFSNSDTWTNIQGHKMHRMRIIIKCQCGERTHFRLGGYVVQNLKHVSVEDDK